MKGQDIIIEILLTISAFDKSILLGFFVLGYILYNKDKIKKTKDQLEAYLSESKSEEQKKPEIRETPVKIHPYKECVIEEYRGYFFTIMKPSGKMLDKVFYSIDDAKEEIDLVYPFFPKTLKEKRKSL